MSTTTTAEKKEEEVARVGTLRHGDSTWDLTAASGSGHPRVVRMRPPVPPFDSIAWNLLAAALYNARHADEPLKTWPEIAANEITRNFYLTAADKAMRAIFPTEGY